MHSTNRSLLAFALCALCAAPAFAGDNPPAKASKPAATTSATTSTMAKTPAASAQSSDAVSARATTREAGRMKEPLVSANAQAQAKAKTNPGKGNWWADADID